MGNVGKVQLMAGLAWAIAAAGHFAAGTGGWVPIAAVVGTTLLSTAAYFGIFSLNVTSARMAAAVALAANGAMVLSATGSVPLALACSLPLMLSMPNELIVRTTRQFSYLQMVPAAALAVTLMAVAWPTGWWGAAAAPNVLFTIAFAPHLLRARKKLLEVAAGLTVKVGSKMPPVNLPTREDGEPFDLAAEKGKHVLLVFIRGDWCPVCHVLMRIVAHSEVTLKKHNVRVAIISPDKGQMDDEAVRRIGLNPGMLFDEDSKVAAGLGLIEGDKDGKPYPIPIGILIDPEGIVRYVSQPSDMFDIASEERMVAIINAAPAPA